jgi:aspartyl-tRNA(Asn)/glutamyl-tRNA(Gln) amidotransferase subunit C
MEVSPVKITPEMVEHVANLARLELSGGEKQKMQSHMSGILDYMDQLQQLDLSSVPATANATDLCNVFREDVVVPSLAPEKGLANAPDRDGTAFRVPRIMEE